MNFKCNFEYIIQVKLVLRKIQIYDDMFLTVNVYANSETAIYMIYINYCWSRLNNWREMFSSCD